MLKQEGTSDTIKPNLKLKSGTHWYEIPWPENKKRASNRFMIKMPDYIGEVYPFRFVEVKGYGGDLKASSSRQDDDQL